MKHRGASVNGKDAIYGAVFELLEFAVRTSQHKRVNVRLCTPLLLTACHA